MSLISGIKNEWIDMYDGFDVTSVGAGTIEPNIYATKSYQKKKKQKLLIGGITQIIYSPFDHDSSPLILSIAYIPKYNAVLAYNLHYVPYKIRKKIVDFVLKENKLRIKNKQPIIVDYYALKRAVPESTKIVRLYKNVGIRVVETYPLREWYEVIKQDSKWKMHYKRSKPSNETVLQRFLRSLKGFVGK